MAARRHDGHHRRSRPQGDRRLRHLLRTTQQLRGRGTAWGTWLTCEEDRTTNHGYVFEVAPSDPENELSRMPIRAMGFFSHEAVDIDPATGIAYLTEDDFRGSLPDDPSTEVTGPTGAPGVTRASCLYR